MSNFFGKKTLNVFTWSNVIDAEYIRKFQHDTGITVNVSYYESNEELLGKIGAGDSGYDLIVPSDYAVDWMIKKNMLKKVDTSRLDFFERLDKRLVGNYFDPKNEYSIPYFWGVYSVIINKEYYPDIVPQSFKLIFDRNYVPQSVCMPSNAREVIMLAAFYLFGDVNSLLDDDKRTQVKNLLIQQKAWVSSYSDERTEYCITSQTSSAVLALSPDYWRIKKESDSVALIIPEEGSLVVIDSFVMPKSTEKDDMIYRFLNYLYSDDAVAHHYIKLGVLPPVTVKNLNNNVLLKRCKVNAIKQFTFFNSRAIPETVFDEIWMALMST